MTNYIYTTRNGEKVELVKDFYPFSFPQMEGQNAEVVIDKDNKAVMSIELLSPNVPPELKRIIDRHSKWFCGYVVFHHTDVPKEFAYDYNREGMSFLNIHGGITYSGLVPFAKDKEEYKKLHGLVSKKHKELHELAYRKESVGETLDDYMDRKMDIMNWYIDEKVRIGYEWIVFGFDTNHHNDENNPLLKDKDHVMQLTIQMEQQINALIDVWDSNFKNLSTDLKKSLINTIRSQAEIDCEIGLGGLLKLLSGEDEI
jgi:hypothetical protein